MKSNRFDGSKCDQLYLDVCLYIQDSNTSQLVFGIPEVIAWVTQFMTLLPGDIILTGSPPGVGAFMKPPQFLAPGDLVECWVEGIGTIANRVV